MLRYCSHTVILPDENHLDDFVVEVSGSVVAYYPFAGEMHSTIYLDTPILLSPRADLDGNTIALTQLTWALHASHGDTPLYAYRLTPCPTYTPNRFVMMKL